VSGWNVLGSHICHAQHSKLLFQNGALIITKTTFLRQVNYYSCFDFYQKLIVVTNAADLGASWCKYLQA
jgi:hypothetical protein